MARNHFGERRMLVGSAYDGDEPNGRRAELHDVEFRQLSLLRGRTARQTQHSEPRRGFDACVLYCAT